LTVNDDMHTPYFTPRLRAFIPVLYLTVAALLMLRPKNVSARGGKKDQISEQCGSHSYKETEDALCQAAIVLPRSTSN